MTPPRRFPHRGRLSCAAVFALAAPACWRGTPPPPPLEKRVEQPRTTAGAITGIVKNSYDGTPVLRQYITLKPAAGEPQTTLTDEKGRYTFKDLPPGTYTLEWYSNSPSRQAPTPVQPTTKEVIVEAGGTTQFDLVVARPPAGPVITPYGAPPYRRRAV